MPEPLVYAAEACRVLGRLKGHQEIGHAVLARLVRDKGLPAHPDPFRPNDSHRRAFLVSEIEEWYTALLTPLPERGRPRKPR